MHIMPASRLARIIISTTGMFLRKCRSFSERLRSRRLSKKRKKICQMNNGVLKTYDSKNQTALYQAKDNRLYEIISIDTDCAVMAAASDDTFAVAAKPFLDEINNVIDFSSIEYFPHKIQAESYSKILHQCYAEPKAQEQQRVTVTHSDNITQKHKSL